MTDRTGESQGAADAARQAAQRVVDSINAWDTSAEEGQIREELLRGLEEAEVRLSSDEIDRLVDEIGDPDTEPQVRAADPW